MACEQVRSFVVLTYCTACATPSILLFDPFSLTRSGFLDDSCALWRRQPHEAAPFCLVKGGLQKVAYNNNRRARPGCFPTALKKADPQGSAFSMDVRRD